MYNKNNLAIAKIASKSDIKPELACVAFYGDRTIATDSFRLIEMSAKGKKHSPYLVKAKHIIDNVRVKKGETIDDDVFETKINGDTFPDVDVLKARMTEDNYVEHVISAELLEGLMSVLKNVSPLQTVTLKVPKEKFKPIIITAENSNAGQEQKAYALLMPVNR